MEIRWLTVEVEGRGFREPSCCLVVWETHSTITRAQFHDRPGIDRSIHVVDKDRHLGRCALSMNTETLFHSELGTDRSIDSEDQYAVFTSRGAYSRIQEPYLITSRERIV